MPEACEGKAQTPTSLVIQAANKATNFNLQLWWTNLVCPRKISCLGRDQFLNRYNVTNEQCWSPNENLLTRKNETRFEKTLGFY